MNALPALSPLSPVGSVLADIRRCIDAKLYYPALLVALTIPEVCVALAMDRSVFVKEKHYAEFVDRYTTPAELGVDGVDCYRLRGGIVHRGNLAGHPKLDCTNVVFTIPETRGGIHALSIVVGEKKAAVFHLGMFCNAMISAAHKWYDENKDHPRVIKNLPNLIRYCPNGLSPFVGGPPVVGSGE